MDKHTQATIAKNWVTYRRQRLLTPINHNTSQLIIIISTLYAERSVVHKMSTRKVVDTDAAQGLSNHLLMFFKTLVQLCSLYAHI